MNVSKKQKLFSAGAIASVVLLGAYLIYSAVVMSLKANREPLELRDVLYVVSSVTFFGTCEVYRRRMARVTRAMEELWLRVAAAKIHLKGERLLHAKGFVSGEHSDSDRLEGRLGALLGALEELGDKRATEMLERMSLDRGRPETAAPAPEAAR